MTSTQLSKESIEIINKAYKKLKNIQNQKTEPIAVIGMGCKFPKANNLEEYWELLSKNIDAISKTPPSRYDVDQYNSGHPDDKINNPYGGYVNDVYDFDARFFDLSPKEALMLDPQQRLLLEVTADSLENANLPTDKLSNVNTSVYVGISSFDYGVRLHSNEGKIDSYLGTGTLLSPAAGRLSYFFNLHGPSLVVDTACSSSLVAIHQAITSLRVRESDISIVGAVGLILEPNLNICFSKANMLSPDGRCKTFDDSANGYVRGEGCASIILKRLSDAVADKDHIQGVILGSAINQDGASGGLTIPSGPSQERVIKQALLNSNITTKDVDYIEAHGTGTSLGDPIEINALGEVFNSNNSKLKVGSVKTNIGHLEACSGLASVIKVILAMQNNMIPASLHFNRPNSKIAWDDLPIEVVNQNTPWKNSERKKVAGVSAFGFSGTNSHIVVSEHSLLIEDSNRKDKELNPGIITISAKDRVSLLNNIKNMKATLLNGSSHIQDVCFTSNIGRNHYKERISFVAKNKDDILKKIDQSIQYLNGESADISNFDISSIYENSNRNITFVFVGLKQNTDKNSYINTYKYFSHNPFFQSILIQCKNILISNNWITEEQWDTSLDENSSISTTKLSLSLLVLSIDFAVAKLMIHIGVRPRTVKGLGLGEYIAGGVAGLFSLEDTLYMIYNKLLDTNHDLNPMTKVNVKTAHSIEFASSSSNPHKVDSSDYWDFHFNQIDSSNSSKIVTIKDNFNIIIGNDTDRYIEEGNTTFLITDKNSNGLLSILSRLYSQGIDLIWDYYHKGTNSQRVKLPTYAWNKKKYIMENKNKKQGYSIVQNKIVSQSTQDIIFDCRISLEKFDYIKDHKIFGKIVFPESTYLEILVEVSDLLSDGEKRFVIEDISLLQSYIFKDNEPSVHMQLICTPNTNAQSEYDIRLISSTSTLDKEAVHVTGKLSSTNKIENLHQSNISELKTNFLKQTELNIESYYSDFAKTGVDYGPSFQSIEKAFVSSGHNEILGLISSNININNFCLSPVMLDGCLQLIAAFLDKNDKKSTYFIMSVGSVQYYRHTQDKVWCHVVKQSTESSFPVFDLELLDEEGNLIAKISKLQINVGNQSTLMLNKTRDWFYSTEWNESINSITNIESELNDTWLIFSENGGPIVKGIKTLLQDNNVKLVDINSNNYKSSIKSVSGSIQGIIFAVDSNEEINDNINNNSLQLCLKLLKLVNSLDNTKARLCVVTQNVHSDTKIRPQQSVLWGMGRVILLEHPRLNPIFIDYEHDFNGLNRNILSDILFENQENQISYKNGLRHISRLKYAPIKQSDSSYNIDSTAAYLITGAFGALGLSISELLVERGAKHLILLSRSGATTEHAKSMLASFKSKGVKVDELKHDISKDQINLPNDISLKGVIHTAGVLDDRLLSNQTDSSFQKVLSPKVQGTWNLHQMTKNKNLDFFVCFSSMTSVIGAMGQSNYAAANYFMDTFCRYRKLNHLPAISINWGPWSGAGMGAKKELIDHWFNMGMSTIDLDEGVLIFERLLNTNYSEIGVMPTDWNKYPDQNNFFEALKKIKEKEERSNVLTKLREADPARRRKMIIEYVESEVCGILGYQEGNQYFEEDQGFFELGMNSLTAIEFKSKLQDAFECQLSSTLTFDYPTIAKLVDYLDSEIVSVKEEDSSVEEAEQEDDSDDDIVSKLSKQLGL